MNNDVNGRESAFNALYDAHYAAVRAYAWRRDPAIADDIVAETFLVAWRRLDDIPAQASLPWLLGVARNSLANMRRGERRRRERELSEAAMWSADESVDSGAFVHEPLDEGGARVWQTLQRLPEGDREVLSLVAWEDLDRAAIADVMGCSKANVALRLHRARRRFQALFDGAGDAAGQGALPVFGPHSSPRTQGVHND